MRITRRQFLKSVIASAAVLGLSNSDLFRLCEVFAGETSPPVIWLQASGCTGCSVSLLNYIDAATGREIDEVLLENISLKYHPSIMAAAGQLAVDTAKNARNAGGYVLVVEGAVPSADYCHIWEDAGIPYPCNQAVLDFAATAARILAVGTCASFGGIPAAGTNPTSASGVAAILPSTDAAKVINLAGCPPHPDWIMGTIVHILLGESIPLDSNKRPKEFYGSGIHPCYRKPLGKATDIGQLGCFLDIGCRRGNCDIPTRGWNNGINWCIRANTPCIGCTDPAFPNGTFYG